MTPADTAEKVAQIYRWIDEQVAKMTAGVDQPCVGCGQCCDFVRYGHRLFVTTPEMIYLAHNLKPDPVRRMPGDACPYMENDKCTIHPHRFSGCRIFFCNPDVSEEKQALLSEAAVRKFKRICDEHRIPYRYTDLKAALNSISQ
jgi:Fe-S-cluster containining protein